MEETLIVTLETGQGAEGMARACNLHGQNSVMPCPAGFCECPFGLNFRCAWVTARQWEEVAKPQRWGSKERVALVAEVLRQKRMVEWLAERLAEANGSTSPGGWIRRAEEAAVAVEFSPNG